jgi:hypothetical protein
MKAAVHARRMASVVAMALPLALSGRASAAGEIFRCEINGVKTFVDSAHNCPGGKADRVGGGAAPASPAAAPPSRTDALPARQLAQPASSETTTACLSNKSSDPAVLRRCLQAQLGTETRAAAQPRLAAISRALNDFVKWPRSEDGLFAGHRKGRPAEWCARMLNDVIAQRNIEVVDDAASAGPLPTIAADILDPNFKLLPFQGRQVVDGYVTLRWQSSHSLVLRMQTACSDSGAGEVSCAPSPYLAVLVHDAEFPVACNVSFIGRTYWPNWQNSMTPVTLNGTR